jgi:hypothetical protein
VVLKPPVVSEYPVTSLPCDGDVAAACGFWGGEENVINLKRESVGRFKNSSRESIDRDKISLLSFYPMSGAPFKPFIKQPLINCVAAEQQISANSCLIIGLNSCILSEAY